MLVRANPTRSNPSRSSPIEDVSQSLDPRKSYEERAKRLASNATGLEKFAYNLLGPSNMASLAFAIDPFSELRMSGAKISPIKRTRKKTCVWPQNRGWHRHSWRTTEYTSPDTSTPEPNDVTPIEYTSVDQFNGDEATWPQLSWSGGFCSDSTIRTRDADSEYGEFELFDLKVSSPARTISGYIRIESYFGGPSARTLQVANSENRTTVIGKGPGCRVIGGELDALVAAEKNRANLYFTKYGYGMALNAVPTRRAFQGIYNLVELRDLPRTIRETVRFFRDSRLIRTAKSRSKLIDTSDKRSGNAFLNWKFGWESTLDAVRDMLATPTRVAKRVNYLLKRQGKPTSYRVTRNYLDTAASSPAIIHDMMFGENFVSESSISRAKIELRLVLNATLNFPSVTVPQVSKTLSDTMWGLTPSPSDVYNLVPWTWLEDWFTGLGDYVSLMDALNQDPSLINFGFITYSCHGNIAGTTVSKVTSSRSISYPPNPGWGESYTHFYNASSAIDYHYQRRIDLAGISGIKAVSKPASLTATQLAIIGALLTKWRHN